MKLSLGCIPECWLVMRRVVWDPDRWDVLRTRGDGTLVLEEMFMDDLTENVHCRRVR